MRSDLKTLVRDMQVLIAKLNRFLGPSTLEDLKSDEMRSAAIQLEFVLIAEVLKRMERISPEVLHRVDAVRDISNFRNVLVHDYDHVDLGIVWDAAVADIPVLKQQIDQWAAELGMEPPPTPASSIKTAS